MDQVIRDETLTPKGDETLTFWGMKLSPLPIIDSSSFPVVGRWLLWVTLPPGHRGYKTANRKAIYPSAAGLTASKGGQGQCLARTLGCASRPTALASHARSAPSGPGLVACARSALGTRSASRWPRTPLEAHSTLCGGRSAEKVLLPSCGLLGALGESHCPLPSHAMRLPLFCLAHDIGYDIMPDDRCRCQCSSECVSFPPWSVPCRASGDVDW